MADWYTAAQVTVNNGETIVRVVSAEPIDAIRPHDSLLIGSFTGRDILQVYTEDVTLDQIIELVLPWDEVTQTLQPARVQPTAVNFNVAADALTTTNNKIASNFTSLMAFGSQASGTVTFTAISELNQDVTVRCINQWDTDLTALENQAQGVVGAVNTIDTQVNGAGGLVEVVSGIDDTLQGYVLSASNSALTANHDAEQTALDRAATSADVVSTNADVVITNADVISTNADVAITNADVILSTTARVGAENAQSNVDAGVLLAMQYANHPENVPIPGTEADPKYSSLHWKQQAKSIAGGDADNANMLGGELPAYYATATALANHTHTIEELGLEAVQSATIQLVQDMADIQQAFIDFKALVREDVELAQLLAMTVGGNPKATSTHVTDIQLIDEVKRLQDQITALQANHP